MTSQEEDSGGCFRCAMQVPPSHSTIPSIPHEEQSTDLQNPWPLLAVNPTFTQVRTNPVIRTSYFLTPPLEIDEEWKAAEYENIEEEFGSFAAPMHMSQRERSKTGKEQEETSPKGMQPASLDETAQLRQILEKLEELQGMVQGFITQRSRR